MFMVKDKGLAGNLVKNIMFDSRVDKTKVRRFDEETEKFHQRIVNQDQYTLTGEDLQV